MLLCVDLEQQTQTWSSVVFENRIRPTLCGITSDPHIELLFLFVFWIPLLVSFQKSIYFIGVYCL